MDKFDGEKIVPEWFADDAACPSELLPVKKLWDQLNEFGPKKDYFPKASNVGWFASPNKKQLNLKKNKWISKNKGIEINHTAQKHSGAVIV